MARRVRHLAAVAGLGACLAGATGCVSGFVYSHVTVPLDLNLDRTPVQAGERGDSWKTLVVPYPVRLRFDWGTDAIGEAARARGLTEIHYADLETVSVLGLWTQRWAHVYGR